MELRWGRPERGCCEAFAIFKRAVTLLEAAFAGFLFSTLMVFLLGVWPAYGRAAEKNRQYLGAAFLARQELEWGMSQPFATLTGRSRDLTLTALVADQSVVTQYHCQLTVSLINPGLKSLAVKVTWPDRNATREVSSATLLAQ